MCGIVGALAFRHSPFAITDAYISRMRDAVAHRGPDGAGTWVAADGRVGLGNRRLAIIDLSTAASQPMSNEDGTLWVTFNGEIYNHAEIRAELERNGNHRWKTDHSDTEVILHGFEEWGIDCLRKFRGMFGIALWDGRARELWLMRDRIGVKPLYYSVHHGRIVFASEIKALLQDADIPRRVNEEGLYHYLSFLTTPAPQTLFEGVSKLPPGTWLRITENGRIHEQRYWDALDHTDPLVGASEEEIAERLLAELRTAVRLRKVSDVPVGVFLSGGIDSSTNTALFSEGEPKPVKTFTVGYDREYRSYSNELIYARQMAQAVGATHHEQLLSVDDLLSFLPHMVYLQDEPIADPVCVPIYYLSRLARDHGVPVCQVGEGADELFCGYPGWKLLLAVQRANDLPVPRSMKKAALVPLRLVGKAETGYYELLRRAADGYPVFWGGAEAFTHVRKERVLSPRLRARFANWSSWDALDEIRHRFEDKAWERSHFKWMSYLDLNFRLPELLLMRVDKMTMGVGLEARVPFLDHKVVELAMSIPDAVTLKHGTLKYILKKAVRGLIPSELIDREKQGFGVPVAEWLLGAVGTRAREVLSAFCAETDFFDPGEVMRLVDQGSRSLVWPLLNFAMWWKVFVAGNGRGELNLVTEPHREAGRRR